MGFTNPIKQLQLAPGTSVAIAGTVDTSGSTVGLAGGSSVGITGGSNGTTSTGPSLASRNVTASSTAVASLFNNTAPNTVTSTLIAAGTHQIELHNLTELTLTSAFSSAADFAELRLIRSDTNADLITPISIPSGSSGGTVSATKDFQGVTLPAGVSVKLQLINGAPGSTPPTSSATVDLNYTLVN